MSVVKKCFCNSREPLSPFRVSPEEGEEKTKKRGKSAPEPKAPGTAAPAEDVVSPPDPLEPWSTKDLANINKLLDTDDN